MDAGPHKAYKRLDIESGGNGEWRLGLGRISRDGTTHYRVFLPRLCGISLKAADTEHVRRPFNPPRAFILLFSFAI